MSRINTYIISNSGLTSFYRQVISHLFPDMDFELIRTSNLGINEVNKHLTDIQTYFRKLKFSKLKFENDIIRASDLLKETPWYIDEEVLRLLIETFPWILMEINMCLDDELIIVNNNGDLMVKTVNEDVGFGPIWKSNIV